MWWIILIAGVTIAEVVLFHKYIDYNVIKLQKIMHICLRNNTYHWFEDSHAYLDETTY